MNHVPHELAKQSNPFLSMILVVDDEPQNVELLTELLSHEGYQNILCETDPEKALSFYNHIDFDLILLDIKMPKIDGFEVMAQIEQINKPLSPPILVMTAQKDQKLCNRALSCGGTDFIYKPFDSEEALNRINNLLVAHNYRKRLSNNNINLEYQVQHRTKALLDTQLKVIKHLGSAAEFRDNETAAHTMRVGEYSKLLARGYGLNSKTAELILHAAPLHDIGKIGIPDSILFKPGKLTPDEWEIMKTHTSIGAKILEKDEEPLIKLAHSIALSHHEKFNGEGYPNGLSGNNIPIEGRIVMLADVYDALTMKRPYKPAWSIADTTKFIKQSSGSQFDPDLVALFLTLQDDFIEIGNRFKET